MVGMSEKFREKGGDIYVPTIDPYWVFTRCAVQLHNHSIPLSHH